MAELLDRAARALVLTVYFMGAFELGRAFFRIYQEDRE